MKRLQILHGTTVENNAFVGRIGELTVNTDDNSLRVHDGETAGGHAVGVKESELRKLFIDIAHPVGSWYASDDPTDPSELFEGTTWVRLTGKKGLVACDNSTDAGSEGGSSSITLTANQLPSHNHSASSDSQGSHSHDRGDMNIYGKWWARGPEVSYCGQSGALHNWNTGQGYGAGHSNNGTTCGIEFSANWNWSGSTGTTGSHSHNITVDYAGEGSSVDIMNPYHATYIWKRIS